MSYVWHCGGNGGYGDVFPGGAADNVILGQFNNEPMFGNRPPAQFVEVITDSMNCLQLTNAMVIITFFLHAPMLLCYLDKNIHG